jgi:hypothetical protein
MSGLFTSIGGSSVGRVFGAAQIFHYGQDVSSTAAPGGLPPGDDGAKSLKTEFFSTL